MKEYEVLNHMVPVTELQAELGSMYLRHHGVIKESSTTTKLRVVTKIIVMCPFDLWVIFLKLYLTM
jgi:hypothetical protein